MRYSRDMSCARREALPERWAAHDDDTACDVLDLVGEVRLALADADEHEWWLQLGQRSRQPPGEPRRVDARHAGCGDAHGSVFPGHGAMRIAGRPEIG